MAKLPPSLKAKNDRIEDMQRLQAEEQAKAVRAENLARLNGAPPPEPEPPVVATPANPEPVEPAAAPAADPDVLAELETLRARIRADEGRTRAEALRANQEQAARLELERKYNEAQERLRQHEEQQQAAQLARMDIKDWFTPQEIADLGEAQCAATLRIAAKMGATTREQMEQRVSAQVAQLNSQLAQHDQQAQKNQRLALFQRLDNTPDIKDWRQWEKDPGFEPFLASVHPVAGETYGTLLNRHANAQDLEVAAQRCAEIYRSYAAMLAPPKPAPGPKTRVLPVGRPPASLPTELPGEQIVTRAMVVEHGRKARDARYRNSQEFAAMEQRINEAAAAHAIR